MVGNNIDTTILNMYLKISYSAIKTFIKAIKWKRKQNLADQNKR